MELPSGIVTLHSPAGKVILHRAGRALGAWEQRPMSAYGLTGSGAFG
ncbi:hypothetical protein [Streptomyces sp. NPDC003514]